MFPATGDVPGRGYSPCPGFCRLGAPPNWSTVSPCLPIRSLRLESPCRQIASPKVQSRLGASSCPDLEEGGHRFNPTVMVVAPDWPPSKRGSSLSVGLEAPDYDPALSRVKT